MSTVNLYICEIVKFVKSPPFTTTFARQAPPDYGGRYNPQSSHRVSTGVAETKCKAAVFFTTWSEVKSRKDSRVRTSFFLRDIHHRINEACLRVTIINPTPQTLPSMTPIPTSTLTSRSSILSLHPQLLAPRRPGKSASHKKSEGQHIYH